MDTLTLHNLTRDEINFLAQVAGVKELHGIPSAPQVPDDEEEDIINPKISLVKKGVLLPSYSLTDNAKLIIYALEQYAKASKYAHFTHLLIGLSDDPDSVSVITTLEKDAKYRVQIMDKTHVLYILCKCFSIFSRTSTEEELHFAQKPLSDQRLERIRELNINDVELFEIDVTTPENRTTILYFIDGGDVIRWDFVKKEFTLASSFFLYKELCDALDIPIIETEEL